MTANRREAFVDMNDHSLEYRPQVGTHGCLTVI
jgi:hypothetical protein